MSSSTSIAAKSAMRMRLTTCAFLSLFFCPIHSSFSHTKSPSGRCCVECLEGRWLYITLALAARVWWGVGVVVVRGFCSHFCPSFLLFLSPLPLSLSPLPSLAVVVLLLVCSPLPSFPFPLSPLPLSFSCLSFFVFFYAHSRFSHTKPPSGRRCAESLEGCLPLTT